MIIPIIIAILIVIITLLDRVFSLFEILFKRPSKPTGAIEIDPVEHIYSHPASTKGLKDLSSFGAKTIYEIILNGVRLYGDRPQFSYRHSSDEQFKSYTYK